MQEIMYINRDDVEKVNYTLSIYNAKVINIIPVCNPPGDAYSYLPHPFGAYVVIEYER